MILLAIIVGLCTKRRTNKVIFGWGCYSVFSSIVMGSGFFFSTGVGAGIAILIAIGVLFLYFFVGLGIICFIHKIKKSNQKDKIDDSSVTKNDVGNIPSQGTVKVTLTPLDKIKKLG